MTRVVFDKIPNTSGEIAEEGRELVCSGSEQILNSVRKKCTIKDRGAEWNLKRANSSKANVEEKLRQTPDAPEFQRSRDRLQASIDKLDQEILELRGQVMREFWADKADGRLSLPPGFWWLMDSIKNEAHLNREFGIAPLPIIDNKKPRPYQEECATELLKYYRASAVLPTGTGKTLLTALLANSMIQQGKRVCVIEPTIELVDQTLKAMKLYVPNISGLGGTHSFKLGCDLLVTTIDSALKHIDIFDGVIVDEFHHSAASTYNDTLLLANQAKHFYGLTACPVRADGLSLGIHAACGPVVYERDTRWAIQNKYLCDVKIGMIQISQTRRLPERMNAATAYKIHMSDPDTCQVMYDLLTKSIAAGRPTLVLFKTVGAGEAFQEFCAARGLQFGVASSEYRHPLRQFRNGETPFLVSNAPLCGEGVDIPDISVVINATQGASENGVRQITGRGLRTATGKEYLSVFDITTTGYKQFEGSYHARNRIYKTITDNITEVVK
jgi:superfamily II DNA or RNA helicase